MRAKILFLFVLLAACAACAQIVDPHPVDPSADLRRENWNYGVWAEYGNGLGFRTNVHIVGAGVRIGRVMTGEHGEGWKRGTFELDADLAPVEFYRFGAKSSQAQESYYTGAVNPIIMKWNFTSGKRWVPYADVEGGLVFSTKDLPPVDTANVNFTSGAAIGFHRFVNHRSAWTFQGKVYHLSNASLGPHNPGVNAAIQFKVGYTWFKHADLY